MSDKIFYDNFADQMARANAAYDASADQIDFEVGSRVVFKGLKGRADLNGLDGTVSSYEPSTKRFAIRIAISETMIAVKRENLEVKDEAEDPTVLCRTIIAQRIGADAAELVSSFLNCTRCLEPCAPGSMCRIPHPIHLRQDLGMMSGPEGMRASYRCQACRQQVTIITPSQWASGAVEVTKETRIEGPEFCFAGVHTTKALLDSDMRRAFPNAVSIAAGPSLQADIDALPVHVQTLTIRSGSGLYDDEMQGVTLEKYLPELQELQLIDVSFEKIVLSAALTPMLRHLKLQNVPDECDLTLELPELRTVSIHFLGDCDEAINTMLRSAARLEKFDSYKLWVEKLKFASNDLIAVDLHRSDRLRTLTLWAPNLRSLGLQACYGLDNLTFLKTHPTLAALLPASHHRPPLKVNTTNANLGPQARLALEQHPKVVKSRTSHQGMMGGMESCHQALHQMLAQDETVDGEREGRVPIEKSADRMSFTNSWNSRATTNMFT